MAASLAYLGGEKKSVWRISAIYGVAKRRGGERGENRNGGKN